MQPGPLHGPPRPQQRQARRRRWRPGATVIMETSAVVEVLRAVHAGRRPPRWFEASRDGGRLAVPRAVEIELKRLRKLNRRGAGSRADLSWLARLGGRDLQWVYDLYREAPIDAGVLSRVTRMHEEAVRGRGAEGGAAAAARSWLRSKRAFVRGRLGYDGSEPLGGPKAGRALAMLNRAAENDRAIMAQAAAIAASAGGARAGGGGGGEPGAVLVSRDGDFTAFADRLEEIAGGAMSIVHYSRM